MSTASVSRVLNGSELVKPAVRARVEEAIRSLNYVPHDAARSLALRRTKTLGAILPTLDNAIFAEGINAFERAARDKGYTLVLSISNYDLDDERHLVRKMIERGVDGLLLIGNDHHPDSFAGLRQAGVQHVCAWTHVPDGPAANVGFSNAAAMVDIIDHLVAFGHRRIGMLAGLTAANDRARERVQGVRNRLADHGLTLPDEHMMEIPYSIRAARQAFPRLAEHQVTALVCGNDVIAIGVLLEALKRGMRVPGDLSITGFDNLTLSGELHPAITTVEVLAETMGASAANLLIHALEDRKPVESLQLPTRLVVRETTGPAPA